MSATEMGLNLKVSAATVFLDLQSVRAHFSLDAESVLAMVDAGELVWVFDIGLGDRRELRFWAKELIAPAECPRTLTTAVQSILGSGATITRGQIERQWVTSAQHVMRLIREKEITLITPSKVSRPSVVNFLTARWAGCLRTATGKTSPVTDRTLQQKEEV